MSSADLVDLKGLHFSLCVSMKARMSPPSWRVERWSPRCNCLWVSSAKRRSTWLSHEAEVGVKWMCQSGRRASQALTPIGLVGGAIVHDHVDGQPVRDIAVDHLDEVEELPGPMAAIALTDDRAGGDVEAGKERGRAVALVVMGSPLRNVRQHRQHRPGSVKGPDQITRPRDERSLDRFRHLLVLGGPRPSKAGLDRQARDMVLTKRLRHFPAVCSCIPISVSIALLPSPSAQRRIMRQRATPPSGHPSYNGCWESAGYCALTRNKLGIWTVVVEDSMSQDRLNGSVDLLAKAMRQIFKEAVEEGTACLSLGGCARPQG